MLREVQVKRLATVYLVIGLALFLFAMYQAITVYSRAFYKLDPSTGAPVDVARRLKVQPPPAAAPKRHVPAAVPQIPIF